MYNSIFWNIFAEDHENEDMPIKSDIHLQEYLSYTNHKYGCRNINHSRKWQQEGSAERLRFHDENENENENENDNEISLSFSLRFCTQRG